MVESIAVSDLFLPNDFRVEWMSARRKMTRIKITVDGNELYEYMDFDLTFKEGHFAFQHHDPGSIVHIRKVEVMPLAD